MKRHFKAFVCVLVVHIVDDVHGVDVHTSEPIHHLFEPAEHVMEVKVLALHAVDLRSHLLACDFISAAVDGIQQTFGEVCPRAKKLHLLAHAASVTRSKRWLRRRPESGA